MLIGTCTNSHQRQSLRRCSGLAWDFFVDDWIEGEAMAEDCVSTLSEQRAGTPNALVGPGTDYHGRICKRLVYERKKFIRDNPPGGDNWISEWNAGGANSQEGSETFGANGLGQCEKQLLRASLAENQATVKEAGASKQWSQEQLKTGDFFPYQWQSGRGRFANTDRSRPGTIELCIYLIVLVHSVNRVPQSAARAWLGPPRVRRSARLDTQSKRVRKVHGRSRN